VRLKRTHLIRLLTHLGVLGVLRVLDRIYIKLLDVRTGKEIARHYEERQAQEIDLTNLVPHPRYPERIVYVEDPVVKK
jgi:hypothetical protein